MKGPHEFDSRQMAHCVASLCSHRRSVTANSHPEENAESSGDAALQEELVKQLTRSMGKQRLIDAAKRSMEKAEKERLKSELQDVSCPSFLPSLLNVHTSWFKHQMSKHIRQARPSSHALHRYLLTDDAGQGQGGEEAEAGA